MDRLEQLVEFALYFQAWVDKKTGYPISYKHFAYGSQFIQREKVRKQMMFADAARIAQADKEDYSEWRRGRNTDAGY